VNFESFQTSGSEHKVSLGGKGVGRFLWLKAFERVLVESVFEDNGSLFKREFDFSVAQGIGDGIPAVSTGPRETTVHLSGFKKEYQRLPSAYRTTQKIAQRILEHCLSFFVTNSAPRIIVRDEEEAIVLNDEYDNNYRNNLTEVPLTLNGQAFQLTHIKLYSTHDQMHKIVLCANKRDVQAISLNRALGTSVQFDDEDRRFVYVLYVTSPYLDENADHYRLDFDLPDDPSPLLGESIVSKSEIVDVTTNAAKEFLKDYLERKRSRTKEYVDRYVATENPALRSVSTYFPQVYDELDPTSSQEKIDEVLHHYKGKTEYSIRQKSESLLRTQSASLDELDEVYRDLTSQITEVQKDNLVQYLCDRQRIIRVLERKLELNADGKFANEDVVHDVIFPRKADTNRIRYEDHNLWLVDEVLAFHDFAASDLPLKESTGAESDERPDILAFAEVGEDKVARAVSLVEFKKPQRTSFDEDPTRQLYRYLRTIKGAKPVRLPTGRDLHVNATTRFYCYAICDLTPAIQEYAENNNYAKLVSELGYYTYNRNHNAHTELLHYDKLVIDAKRRHKAFFAKLGIG
jgi:hypothetical protein